MTQQDIIQTLEAWVETYEHCSITEGYCCCGDSMDNHPNPMDCGHAPVDHGSYHAHRLYERTKELLEQIKKGSGELPSLAGGG